MRDQFKMFSSTMFFVNEQVLLIVGVIAESLNESFLFPKAEKFTVDFNKLMAWHQLTNI